MAEVVLRLGGRAYPIACAAGQEPRLEALGAMLSERWDAAQRAAGTAPAERVLLLLALMLADSLDEARSGHGAAHDRALDEIAERLEAIASALEAPPPSP